MRVCTDTHIKRTFCGQLGSWNLVTMSGPGNADGIGTAQNVLVPRRRMQK